MAILNWGKPLVEIKKEGTAVWSALSSAVEGTTTLETEEGEIVEALEEGGGVVDTIHKKSKYTLTLELFQKKGSTKPIEDVDGIITDNYSVRLTPEDPTAPGFIIDKASVGFSQTWSAADGGRWKYSFKALVPDSGAILKEYIKEDAD